MKNHKQLLADFYLALLDMPEFKNKHQALCDAVLNAIVIELGEEPDLIKDIFEKMASEDAKAN